MYKVLSIETKSDDLQQDTYTRCFLGLTKITQGKMSQGMKMIKEARQSCIKSKRKYWYALMEYILGRVFLQIIEGTGPKSISVMMKNIGFLVKNIPIASKTAETHLLEAIKAAEEIDAKGIPGQAYHDLGKLHHIKKKTHEAYRCISNAIQIFEQCEADVYLKQAEEAIKSVG
jgi:hypothetical protein